MAREREREREREQAKHELSGVSNQEACLERGEGCLWGASQEQANLH